MTTWTYVYRVNAGAWGPAGTLYSSEPDGGQIAPPSVLTANGLAAVSGQPAQNPSTGMLWDPGTLTIVQGIAPVVANYVTPAAWIMQFTPAEFAAIKASSDPLVQQFLFALTAGPTLNLNNPLVTNGLAYLVSVNLLTQPRATALQTVTGV